MLVESRNPSQMGGEMATKSMSALDKLKGAAKKATAAPAKKATEMREKDIPSDLRKQVVELCELAAVYQGVEPQFEQHKSAIAGEFFAIYVKEMWDNRTHPANFKVVNRHNGMEDSKLNFILKFRNDGIKKKFSGELPENKTLNELVIETLISVAGLSEKNAHKFFSEEVEIKEKYETPLPINEMAEGDNPLYKSIADKVLGYFFADTKAKSVTLPAFTDEEKAAAWVLKQEVLLKDGVEERIWNYCESLDQLIKLLNFCAVTKQISNFDFGISDDLKTKTSRLKAAAAKYLDPQ